MAHAPPASKSLLGRHRLLAPNASVRVSPLCLGGMSTYTKLPLLHNQMLINFQGLGDRWKAGFGEFSKEGAFELLDAFYDLGGNFIDTANAYHGGQSEEWIGEWLQKTGRRDEMVISTKYTMGYKLGQPVQQSNFGGSGTKSMHTAIQDSLKRLQTSYIDLVRRKFSEIFLNKIAHKIRS